MSSLDDHVVLEKVGRIVAKAMRPATKTLKSNLLEIVSVRGTKAVDKAIKDTTKVVFEKVKRLNVTKAEVEEWVANEFREYWVRQLVVPSSSDFGL